MLTILSGVFISILISIAGQNAPCQRPPDNQHVIKCDDRVPDDKGIFNPVEALGGGFKKHRQ